MRLAEITAANRCLVGPVLSTCNTGICQDHMTGLQYIDTRTNQATDNVQASVTSVGSYEQCKPQTPSVIYLKDVRISVWVESLVADHGVLYSRLCQVCARRASDLATSLGQPRRGNVSVMRLNGFASAGQSERRC